eukprot:TRINITY_DN64761_c0_g1_i1.p1 TRINITY_DN64761_c0_g1~~TRINITY_DN64761_c0_g1_i1.p1  ORF type:complete len:601 (-),score=24.66 TRINITY_DN64761_c0_g1_i1:44-1846(-)
MSGDSVEWVCLGAEDSWFVQYSNGDWQCRGLDEDLMWHINKRKTKQSQRNIVKKLSLGPDEQWWALFNDGSWAFRINSSECRTLLEQYTATSVTFFEGGGWYISFDDGSTQWENIPDALTSIVSSHSVEWIASGYDGWFAKFSGSQWKTNISELSEHQELKQASTIDFASLSLSCSSYFLHKQGRFIWNFLGEKQVLNAMLDETPSSLDPFEIAFSNNILHGNRCLQGLAGNTLDVCWMGSSWWAVDNHCLLSCQRAKLKSIPVRVLKDCRMDICGDGWSASMCGESSECEFCTAKFTTVCGSNSCCCNRQTSVDGIAARDAHREVCSKNPANVIFDKLKYVSDVHAKLSPLLIKAASEDDHICGVKTVDILRRIAVALNDSDSRIYSLQDADYGLRGGRPYFKPCGWVRFAIGGKTQERLFRLQNWCVAYHGTSLKSSIKILVEGLRQPGTSGVRIAHGQAYSETQKSIYASPALGYASFPVYAPLEEVGENHWVQCVLQLRVRPGSFVEKPGSLSNKHWPEEVRFDRNFASLQGLEWIIEDPADHEVVGLLVRELGNQAAPSVYGEFVQNVSEGSKGPEYELTTLLEAKHRANGWLVS